MSAARASRLPGFKFETQAPPLDEVLPRMDIAVFVGFAASGPLERPVALESVAQFAAIFGRDAPLAWDVERGEQLYAHLAPAVRAFFANGGQRCWVIRVARRKAKPQADRNYARYNYFPIPGLARAAFDKDGQKIEGLRPAFARARSQGSWSDSLVVGSALLSRSFSLLGVTFPQQVTAPYVVHLAQPTSQDLATGNLLRLTFKDDQLVLFLVVERAEQVVNSPPGRTTDVTASKAIWFQVVATNTLPPPGTSVKVGVFTREDNSDLTDPISGFQIPYDGVLNPDLQPALSPLASPPGGGGEETVVTLQLFNCSPADAPAPGSVIRVKLGVEEWWLTVADVSFGAGETQAAFVSGNALRSIGVPNIFPAANPACECLTFEVWVRQAEEYSVSLSDLGFASGDQRYWGLLPTDEELYQDVDAIPSDAPANTLWSQAGELLRFPLAGIRPAAAAHEIYFPLSIATVPDNFLGRVKLEGTELERDGLDSFDSSLFTDPALAATLTEALLSEADFLRYQAPLPRALSGVHGAMVLEEATSIAVPDAVHRGWSKTDPGQPPEPGGQPSPERLDWWPFLDCRKSPAPTPALQDCDPAASPPSPIQLVREPLWGNFLNCSISVIVPPRLLVSEKISTAGTFTLSWPSSPPIAATYILEEATSADFTDAEEIYSGGLISFTIYGHGDGDYFYRVNATVNSNTSDWSMGVAVRVATNRGSRLNPENQYTAEVLLAVQRALLRLCTVRGDLFCVLSLPEHYREDKAIEHVGLLKQASLDAFGFQDVPPLGLGESNDFSYGAVFHPWLVDRDESQVSGYRRTPPCGAASGVIAKRSLLRGAWIAPANEPLRNVVALEPPINRDRYLDLQEARINLVRQEPRGFIVLDADTLSDDLDLGLINVRRLLMLLRRQALRLGMTYVFEPNNPAFRRLVECGFTDMLDQMFIRGAFAGATPATSYQVVADDSLNTAESVDLGRFIVELRVAPSLPMNFLTIRLVQNGDRSSISEGR